MTAKRIAINIAAIVFVAALLVGAMAVLNMEDENANVIPEENGRFSIFKCDSAEIEQIEVTNATGEFAFVKADGTWRMRHYEGAALLVSMVDSLARSFSDVESDQRVEEAPEDLSLYGLDEPAATVRVALASAEEKTFFIGDETSDKVQRYFNTDTSSDVYVINSSEVDYALRAQADFRDKSVAQRETSDIDEVEIKKNSKTTIRLKLREGGARDNFGALSYWNIVEPYEKSASNQEVETRILQYAASVTADAYEDYTVANMAAFGLNNPQYTLRVHLVSGSEDIYSIGAAAPTGGRYVYMHGSDYIFVVSDDALAFLDTDPYALLEKYIALVDIKTCANVELTSGLTTVSLAVVDPDGELEAYYVDNKEVLEDDFKDFYQLLIGLTFDGEADAAAQGETLYSIKYTLQSGETISIAFAPYDERNYAVYIGGQCEFFIRQKKVESLFASLARLKG